MCVPECAVSIRLAAHKSSTTHFNHWIGSLLPGSRTQQSKASYVDTTGNPIMTNGKVLSWEHLLSKLLSIFLI